MTRFTHLPDSRWLVVACLAGLAVIVASYLTGKGRAGGLVRGVCAALRAVAAGALTLCLLDPQWIERLAREHPVRLAVLLDASGSMATGDVPGGRLAAAREWLGANLTSRKPAAVDLRTYRFSDRVLPETNGMAAAPTGTVSAVGRALESMLSAPDDTPLAGVVLVSDGIDTTDASPEAAARRLRRRGIPVHTLAVGTTNETRDVILENVQVKRAVPNEAPTRVALTLRSPGYANLPVTVQIRREREVLAARTVTLNGPSQRLELDFTPRGKGFQIFEASVNPVPGEWLAANNRRLFGLEVVDPTIRVLYMEGTPQNGMSPQPEWKYLKDALQSDPGIKVTTLYRQFGNNGQYLNTIDADQETGERIFPVEHPTKGFPRTLDGLLQYDVVIHSDIRKESFTADQLVNMSRLVEEFGGGFVMIGGNSAFGRGGYHRTVLDRIIPVAMEGAYDSERVDFKVRIPRAAWTHPIVAFSADRAETRRIWGEKFPYLHGLNRMARVKPGATVLATTDEGYGGPEGGDVVLAVQEVGRGRSMAFTSDTTRSWGEDFETIWGEPVNARWGLAEGNCDSRYYRRFWVNAVRWLAAGRAGRTNQPVALELARGYGAPGEAVRATVKVRDAALHDVAGAGVRLFLGDGASSNAVAVARYDPAARAHVADIRIPRDGAYVVTAVASLGGAHVGDDRQLLVGESIDREMSDLRARPDIMAAVAAASGGTAYRLGETPPDLAALWKDRPQPTVEFQRKPLWDKPWWLGAVLAVLSLEWAIRRWRGMA